jgi:hypothetical protein
VRHRLADGLDRRQPHWGGFGGLNYGGAGRLPCQSSLIHRQAVSSSNILLSFTLLTLRKSQPGRGVSGSDSTSLLRFVSVIARNRNPQPWQLGGKQLVRLVCHLPTW